jgi:hypothetical protein
MMARGSVWAGASTQLDLALVEMLLEPEALRLSDGPVLVGGSGLAAAVEECLVVADHILVEENGDVGYRNCPNTCRMAISAAWTQVEPRAWHGKIVVGFVGGYEPRRCGS